MIVFLMFLMIFVLFVTFMFAVVLMSFMLLFLYNYPFSLNYSHLRRWRRLGCAYLNPDTRRTDIDTNRSDGKSSACCNDYKASCQLLDHIKPLLLLNYSWPPIIHRKIIFTKKSVLFRLQIRGVIKATRV